MKKANELKAEFLKTMIQLSTAGFGLVAALAWNDAIQTLIGHFFPDRSGLTSKFFYAVLVTALAVIITYILGKAAARAQLNSEADSKKK